MRTKLVYLFFAAGVLFGQKSLATCNESHHEGLDKSNIDLMASKFGVTPESTVSLNGEDCSVEVSYKNEVLFVSVKRTDRQDRSLKESFEPAPFFFNSGGTVMVKSSSVSNCDYTSYTDLDFRTLESDHSPLPHQRTRQLVIHNSTKTGKVEGVLLSNVESELMSGNQVDSYGSYCYFVQ